MKQNEKSLGQRFGSLFDYLITRRAYLIEAGLSGKTEYRQRSLLNKFLPYLGQKWTDQGAAEFIHNNFVEIRQIVPVRETNTMNRLENLWMTAKTFFIIQSKKTEPCSQLSIF